MHLRVIGRKMKHTGLVILLFFSVISSVYCEEPGYDSKSKRDPFVPLVGVEKNQAAGLANAASIDDVKLEGIAVGSKGNNKAIMNGELIKERDKIGNVEIKRITDKTVTLLISGVEYAVNLPEEGGIKGEK